MGARAVIVVILLLGAWLGVPVASHPSGGTPSPTRSRALEGFRDQPSASHGAGDSRTSEPVQAPFAFSAVGFHVPDGAELRYRTAWDGKWTAWNQAEVMEAGQEPGPGTPTHLPSELQWTGIADELQVAVVGASPRDVRARVIDSMGLSGSSSRAWAGGFGPRPALAVDRPDIVTRAEWGADESLRSGEPSYAEVRFGVLHHTVNRNDYTRTEAPGIVRAIYEWHVKGNGWSDIGYNLLVDRFGRVYEGRYGGLTRGVIGAHAFNSATGRGYNRGSFGIAVLGDFDQAEVPSVVVDSLVRTIGWKYEVHGLDPNADGTFLRDGERLATLVGHRDVDRTSCPGRSLYALLPELRSQLQVAVMADFTPLVGDWDGDGDNTPGWYHRGMFHYTNESEGGAGHTFRYGRPGDIVVVGDWDGDGDDTVGVVRPQTGRWHLRDSLTSGPADRTLSYGRVDRGDRPVTGDWGLQPGTEIGVIRGRSWMLSASSQDGTASWTFNYGRVDGGDLPIVGDWDGDGRDTVGIVRPSDGRWHLRDRLEGGAADRVIRYGNIARLDRPVSGDWSNSGLTGVGVVRGSRWHLRDTPTSGHATLDYPYRG